MNNKVKITNHSSGLVNVINEPFEAITLKPWELDLRYSQLNSITSINELQMQTAMEADSSLVSYFKSLVIGGKFYIVLPDFNHLASVFMNADWSEKKLRDANSQLRAGRSGIFGTQRRGNPVLEGYDAEHSDCHRSGYNKQSLEFLLNRVGFIDVSVSVEEEGVLHGYGKKTMLCGERQISQSLDNIRKDHLNRYQFATEFLKEHHPHRLLDLACGIGYGSSMLNSALNAEVIGVDIDEGAIDYARQYYSANNIEYICKNAQNLNLPKASFDGIVSFETIEHVPFDQVLINSFYELLKLGGVLVCSTPNESVMPFDKTKFPFHIKHYTNSELIDMLQKSGFKDIQLFTQKDPVNGKVEAGEDGYFTIAVAIK